MKFFELNFYIEYSQLITRSLLKRVRADPSTMKVEQNVHKKHAKDIQLRDATG